MSNFQKIVNGVSTGTAVQGTDIASGSATDLQVLTATGSGGSSWVNANFLGAPAPTVQSFTSGSGTYTTPANVAFIVVKMVGGGGGGSGSGYTSTGSGGAGGNTTFGTSLLVANGGAGGPGGILGQYGGAGGTASLGSGPIGTAVAGISGGSNIDFFITSAAGNISSSGGQGGASPLASFGAGGAGGLAPGIAGFQIVSGTGGGAGGFVDAIITSPAATYAYAVGAGGTAGSSGGSGGSGIAGGSGYIIVTEYYYNGLGANGGNGGAYTPTQTILTSGSGTYTTPANASYIRVQIWGGGGGGAGTGISGGGTGGSGGTSSFDSGTYSASGGAGNNDYSGVPGGIGSGCTIIGTGATSQSVPGNIGISYGGYGGTGASSLWGGGGVGGNNAPSGGGNASSYASGGGGAGGNSGLSIIEGGGGGAGGYGEQIILSPSPTYSYIVGVGGAGGSAGMSGAPGGNGYQGIIVVTEYYNNGAVGTATNVTGIVATANGGTGQSSFPGSYYASVYYPATSSNYWSGTSSSFSQGSIFGTTPTPSVIVNSNFGTIGKEINGYAGINFTAPRTGTIKITAMPSVFVSGTQTTWAMELSETNTPILISYISGYAVVSNEQLPTTLTGYLPVISGNTYNVTLSFQSSQSPSTTVTIGSIDSGGSQLSFVMDYIV